MNDKGNGPLYFALVPVHSAPSGPGVGTCLVTGRRLAETGGDIGLSPEAVRVLSLVGSGTVPDDAECDMEAALARVVAAMAAPETPRSLEEAVEAARGTLLAARARKAAVALRGAVVPRDAGRFARLSPEARPEIPEGYSAELEGLAIRRRPRPYGEQDRDWPAGTGGRSWPASRMGYLRWLAGRLEGYGNELQEPVASLVRDGLVTLAERSTSVSTRITDKGLARLLAEDRDEAHLASLPGGREG